MKSNIPPSKPGGKEAHTQSDIDVHERHAP